MSDLFFEFDAQLHSPSVIFIPPQSFDETSYDEIIIGTPDDVTCVSSGFPQEDYDSYDPALPQLTATSYYGFVSSSSNLTTQEADWRQFFQQSGAYTPGGNYCGSGAFDVPDTVAGVYIGEDCFNHDQNYSPASTMDRAAADVQLFHDIYDTMRAGGASPDNAFEVAITYYIGVRLGGWCGLYEGQGSNF